MFAYLTMTVGQREGRSFPLETGAENRIGRGPECQVVLDDPLCSRIHAVLSERDGCWRLRDESTNGTFVNGEPIEEAALADGHILRIGSTEFSFHQSEQAPTTAEPFEAGMTQTLVRETPVTEHGSGEMVLAALRDLPEAEDLLLMHQFSVRLLSRRRPGEVIRDTLELVRERTEASSVSFLATDDKGRLITKAVLPADAAERAVLSESMTRLVVEGARALWIANQQTRDASGRSQHDADALYVPLVDEDAATGCAAPQSAVLGALHIYLKQKHFRQSQFDFAISAANIASVALARCRRDQRRSCDLQQLRDAIGSSDQLIGESRAIKNIKAEIPRIARANGCVLLGGERGVGKKFIARLLHGESRRANRPFLIIRCGRHGGEDRGIFRDGEPWRMADLGAVYLDDVSQLDEQEQNFLLEVLHGEPILFDDEKQKLELSIRIFAGTTIDLQRMARQEKFSPELHGLLKEFDLHLPPLRDRREDVPLLSDHFLRCFQLQHGRPQIALSDGARQKLLEYEWPGNVLELRNVLDTAVTATEDEVIGANDLLLPSSGPGEGWESLRIDHWERKLIVTALKRAGGNVPEAAKLLGIGRATLYRKIDEYEIRR